MKKQTLDSTFHTLLVMKAFGGITEIISGIFLLFIRPDQVYQLISHIVRTELLEDPNDLIGNWLVRYLSHLTASTEFFFFLYMMVHGVIKIGLVIALWKKYWFAYPGFMCAILGFSVYQLLRFTQTHSIFLIIFTAFDFVIVWFTWQEYQMHMQRVRAGKESLS